EPVDTALRDFYLRLLDVVKLPAVRGGNRQLLNCRPAGGGNPTWKRFLAFAWEGARGGRLLVAGDYGHTQGQCYLKLPWPGLRGRPFLLRDRLGPARYERDGTALAERGLYLDIPEWHYHVFDVMPG